MRLFTALLAATISLGAAEETFLLPDQAYEARRALREAVTEAGSEGLLLVTPRLGDRVLTDALVVMLGRGGALSLLTEAPDAVSLAPSLAAYQNVDYRIGAGLAGDESAGALAMLLLVVPGKSVCFGTAAADPASMEHDLGFLTCTRERDALRAYAALARTVFGRSGSYLQP